MWSAIGKGLFVMISVKSDSSKSIYNIGRAGAETDFRLNWTSRGFELFLVLSSTHSEDADLTGVQAGKILDTLNSVFEELRDDVNLKHSDMRIRLVSFVQLKKNGGVQLEGEPGFYAVYGAERTDGQHITVYVDEGATTKSHILRILRDIEVTEAPHMVQEGFLHKKSTYSGYHQISVKGPQAGLSGGVLNYSVGPYTYPFPDEVLTRGGTFFVKMNEMDAIQITTENLGLNVNLRRVNQ